MTRRILPILIAVLCTASACDKSEPTPSEPAETSAAPTQFELPPPPPAPPIPTATHQLRFATDTVVACQDAQQALAGKCEGPYAQYAPKIDAGGHVWIGQDEGLPEGTAPFFHGPDQKDPSGIVATANLSEAPNLAELEKVRETWSDIPVANRKNLTTANKDALFRVDVPANLASPKAKVIDGIPHPTSPLTLEYVGEPAALEMRFADCLLDGSPESWVSHHECLLDATCAEMKYACTQTYCDTPTFVVKPVPGQSRPTVEVVAIADRMGTFSCTM